MYNDCTLVILLKVRGCVIGVVVSSVSDVLALDAEDIKPALQLNSTLKASLSARQIVELDFIGILQPPRVSGPPTTSLIGRVPADHAGSITSRHGSSSSKS